MPEGVFEFIESYLPIDWNNFVEAGSVTRELLEAISSDSKYMSELFDGLNNNSDLLEKCEHFDMVDQLILYDHLELGLRIRLHMYADGYYDRPHNHRWPFSARVLSGSYRHEIFGTTSKDSEDSILSSHPTLVTIQDIGSTYTLHQSIVHSVIAEPKSVTMIIRGPAVASRFLIGDRTTGRVWWRYGRQSEDEETRNQRRISKQGLQILSEHLRAQGILV